MQLDFGQEAPDWSAVYHRLQTNNHSTHIYKYGQFWVFNELKKHVFFVARTEIPEVDPELQDC